MGITWDDTRQMQLLLMVIHVQNVANTDWAKVAKLMGDGFAENAIKQKFYKMKREIKEQFGDPTEDGVADSTPKQRGGKAGGGSKSAGSKRKGKDVDVDVDEDAAAELNDGEEESPTKKVKKEMSVEHADDGDLV